MKPMLGSYNVDAEIMERRQVNQLADKLGDGRLVKISDFNFIYRRLQHTAILLDALKNSVYQLHEDVPELSQVELQLLKVANVLDEYMSDAQTRSEDDSEIFPF